MLRLLNMLAFNIALLCYAAAVLKVKFSFRVLSAAAAGTAVYGVFIRELSPVAVLFAVCLLMLEQIAVFGWDKSVRTFLLLAVSGTAAYAAGELTARVILPGAGMELLLSAVLLLICGRAATALRRSGAWKRKDRVYIRTGRGEMCLKTLKDSGNLLREPRSGLPVIVVRAEDAAEAAPLSVLFALGMSDTDDETVIYPVPYRSLGGSGVLYGFRPESCIMDGTDVKCVVALCRGSDMFGGDCSALCNPDVLEV